MAQTDSVEEYEGPKRSRWLKFSIIWFRTLQPSVLHTPRSITHLFLLFSFMRCDVTLIIPSSIPHSPFPPIPLLRHDRLSTHLRQSRRTPLPLYVALSLLISLSLILTNCCLIFPLFFLYSSFYHHFLLIILIIRHIYRQYVLYLFSCFSFNQLSWRSRRFAILRSSITHRIMLLSRFFYLFIFNLMFLNMLLLSSQCI